MGGGLPVRTTADVSSLIFMIHNIVPNAIEQDCNNHDANQVPPCHTLVTVAFSVAVEIQVLRRVHLLLEVYLRFLLLKMQIASLPLMRND